MKIARIWAGDDGTAHIDEIDEPTMLSEYVPGMPTERTRRLPATDVSLASMPAGVVMAWHASPRRHLCITLSGTVEIRVGDGSARRFSAGEIYLGEDRTGQGHETEAIGPEPWAHMVVSLPN